MEEEIIPFLNELPEDIIALYERSVGAFDSVVSSIDEIQLHRLEQDDVSNIINMVEDALHAEGRNLIADYYIVAHNFLQSAYDLLPIDGDNLGWFASAITNLINKQSDDRFRALCFYQHAVKSVFQFLHLHTKGEKNEVERILAAKGLSRMRITTQTVVQGAINGALTAPMFMGHIAVAGWQNLTRSYVWSSRPRYLYLQPHFPIGLSFADLAYSEADAIVDGNIVKDANPYGITIGKKTLSGRIELPHDLRIVLCVGFRNSIIVCIRGTISNRNWLTNLIQFCFCDDVVYHMALGFLLTLIEQNPGRNIEVYGHSLGGGLTQFAVAGADDSRTTGIGYNSAGLSRMTLSRLPVPVNYLNLSHFHLRNDVVFNIGNHIGDVYHSNCCFNTGCDKTKVLDVHSRDKLRIILNCNRYWKLN